MSDCNQWKRAWHSNNKAPDNYAHYARRPEMRREMIMLLTLLSQMAQLVTIIDDMRHTMFVRGVINNVALATLNISSH